MPQAPRKAGTEILDEEAVELNDRLKKVRKKASDKRKIESGLSGPSLGLGAYRHRQAKERREALRGGGLGRVADGLVRRSVVGCGGEIRAGFGRRDRTQAFQRSPSRLNTSRMRP